MICKKCGGENSDNNKFCQGCGTELGDTGSNSTNSAYNPYYTNNYVKRTFTKGDLFTITGFISSILGMFYFWLIFCPLGLGLSIAGYKLNKTRALSVSGIIISSMAIIIKIGMILYDLNILPTWLTSGVFW